MTDNMKQQATANETTINDLPSDVHLKVSRVSASQPRRNIITALVLSSSHHRITDSLRSLRMWMSPILPAHPLLCTRFASSPHTLWQPLLLKQKAQGCTPLQTPPVHPPADRHGAPPCWPQHPAKPPSAFSCTDTELRHILPNRCSSRMLVSDDIGDDDQPMQAFITSTLFGGFCICGRHRHGDLACVSAVCGCHIVLVALPCAHVPKHTCRNTQGHPVERRASVRAVCHRL